MATLATTKEAVTAPFVIEHVWDATTVPPDRVHAESLGEKPTPDTWTVAPARAVDGLRVIDGAAALTLKLDEAESPPGFPVAVTV